MQNTKDGNGSPRQKALNTKTKDENYPEFLVDNSHESISKDASLFKAAEVDTFSQKENEETSNKEMDFQSGTSGEERRRSQDKLNIRALPNHAKTYQMEKFKKNAMIIFNFINVDGYSEPRIGTEKDEQVLRETFSQFGFEIENPHVDLIKSDLFKVLEEFSDRDFTDYGCVVVVVLTHGTSQGLLRAKDEGQFFHETDIINQFKSYSKPTLITKPVILIIQACRGTASTQGVAVLQSMRIPQDRGDEVRPYYLPVESDMLIFHSSFVGKPSFRPVNGSWLIQTLCKQVNKLYLTHDLESILIEVKREVAIEKYSMEHNRLTDNMDVNKQMPVVTSTLIRKLFLRKFNDKSPRLYLPVMPKEPAGETSTRSQSVDLSEDTCLCFLDHFGYMKTCLSHVVQTNPGDHEAKCLLSLADSESGVNDEKAKATLILMSSFLQRRYKDSDYHKFIYFYGSGCAIEFETMIEKDSAFKKAAKKWSEWSQTYVLRTVGTCIGACVIYNLLKIK